ncbi:MAG: caspase family protein [Alphaproteobacteria bacterium]|nr:caspase family protein [Alphaproteobacteria bacterium]
MIGRIGKNNLIALLVVALLALLQSDRAHAERRLALVIGINDYGFLPKLEKAVGDATAMSAALEALGFEVTKLTNPNRRDLNVTIADFASKVTRDDLVLVHFSGHGVEIDGDNYLLPADVPKPKSGRKDAVKYESIGFRRLISQISDTGARTRIFVLDACRDNPFEQAGSRAIGSTRGLARTEAPAGTFIMYSAGYRQTALDTLGPDDAWPTSVYTRVLINKLNEAGKPISQIARDVRNEVRALARTAGHNQRPAYYDELSAGLILKEAPKKPEPAPAQPVQEATAPQPDQQRSSDTLSASQLLTLDLAYWNAVKDSTDPDELRSYIKQYPKGRFIFLATVRLRNLQNLLKKQPRRALFVRNPVEEEAEDKADPEIDELPVMSKRDLAQNIQKELLRLGCDPGRPDGSWGRNSKRALGAYSRHQNRRLASLNPSPEILQDLQGHSARVCPLICDRLHEVRGDRCVKKTCSRSERLNSEGRCVARVDAKKKKNEARKKRDAQKKRDARRKTETRKKNEARRKKEARKKTKRQRQAKLARSPKPRGSSKRCGRCMKSKWGTEFFHLCGSAYARSSSQRLCK